LPKFDPGTGKLLFDSNGNVVPSSLTLQPANYDVLGRMSAISNAKFYRATNRQELQSIYNDIDRLEKTEIKLRRFTTYHTPCRFTPDLPLFQLPLIAALGLFAIELILTNTRFRKVPCPASLS